MPKWFNILSQIILVIIQAMNIVAPLLSEKDKILAAAVVAAIQGVIAVVAHNYNPDGSKACEPYNKLDTKDTEIERG